MERTGGGAGALELGLGSGTGGGEGAATAARPLSKPAPKVGQVALAVLEGAGEAASLWVVLQCTF